MPTSATPHITLGAVVLDVAQRTGVWRNQMVATAGATTSTTDAANEKTPTANANSLIGQFLYWYAGTGFGQSAEISGYTIGVPTYSAITASDSTSRLVRLAIRPQIILNALTSIMAEYARNFPQDYPYDGMISNNLLSAYGMEEWASGAAAAPDGAVLSGAGASVAREGTTIAQGLYSAKLTAGAGAVGVLTWTVPEALLRNLGGSSVLLYGMLAENVAGDGTIRVAATDYAGTATNTDRVGTYAGNRWQRSDKDISSSAISLTNPVTGLTVALRNVASAVTYLDDLALCANGLKIREYDLPATMIGLDPRISMETEYGSGIYTEHLDYPDAWEIRKVDGTGTAPRRIYFKTDLPPARHLRLNGYRASAALSTATAAVEMNTSALTLLASQKVLASIPTTPERAARLAGIEAEIAQKQKDAPSMFNLTKDLRPRMVPLDR